MKGYKNALGGNVERKTLRYPFSLTGADDSKEVFASVNTLTQNARF